MFKDDIRRQRRRQPIEMDHLSYNTVCSLCKMLLEICSSVSNLKTKGHVSQIRPLYCYIFIGFQHLKLQASCHGWKFQHSNRVVLIVSRELLRRWICTEGYVSVRIKVKSSFGYFTLNFFWILFSYSILDEFILSVFFYFCQNWQMFK